MSNFSSNSSSSYPNNDNTNEADNEASQSAADLLVKAQQGDQSKLSPEDLARVQQYLSSPIHSVERKPFKPWMMMLALISVVVILGLLSQMIAWFVL
ncbi:MAG TPA: hypothetical protein DCE61_06255 [Cellvibrionales bacterium]|jgi:hypothetical protein|nr:hypothetical protein [Cellvibrionales bacterium]HAW14585.1 hypothetical protein [Cellvibrionales bacterium]